MNVIRKGEKSSSEPSMNVIGARTGVPGIMIATTLPTNFVITFEGEFWGHSHTLGI